MDNRPVMNGNNNGGSPSPKTALAIPARATTANVIANSLAGVRIALDLLI
ncbi:MAG TPA: hypothetical protein VGX92_22455 [Pyrinomonadaceae bacterium]|nr:hypothetical protein [Pyrinomonadaceae bacterium]